MSAILATWAETFLALAAGGAAVWLILTARTPDPALTGHESITLCLPGCIGVPGWDHRCVARLATLSRPPLPDGRPRAVVVEVDQESDGRRTVVLAGIDPDTARYLADPIDLDLTTVAALAAALTDARGLALAGAR